MIPDFPHPIRSRQTSGSGHQSREATLPAIISNRRGFLRATSFATLTAALGGPIPFARSLAPGLFPDALAQAAASGLLGNKRGLRILSESPLNAETPPELLDDDITPVERHFVRNNGHVPDRALRMDLAGWTLTVDGEVERPLKLTLPELQQRFRNVTRTLTMECAGNGRSGFVPAVSGNPWTTGAVACAIYTGVRLGDVLRSAGVKRSAVYIGYIGEDPHTSRAPGKLAMSRGVPIAKALDEHTLLAWAMNGQPLPALHGFPLRLMCPGWAASTCGKWLARIWVRDRVHDGEKMTGMSYRMPRQPVAPGSVVAPADMAIIGEMPVKSLITFPATGTEVSHAKPLLVRGHAWSGWGDVKSVQVSRDFGASWITAKLSKPRNRFAWQRWETALRLPMAGHYEVWARATDEKGNQQPMVVPGWNPEGYFNNSAHRIALKAV